MNKSAYAALAAAALTAGAWFALPGAAPAVPASLWRQSYAAPNGERQALAQWRGRPLVVNFWASWCPPCREEMPDFDRLRRQYRAHGVEFVGIALDTPENVAAFLRHNPVSYPILLGDAGAHALSRELGGMGLPHTLVLDRDGKITLNQRGRLAAAALDAALRPVAN